jgi:hypothetical protein
VLSSVNVLFAAETDSNKLIDLLKSKNIITQQEADSLIGELKANSEKERVAIREEIKKDAAKGEFLPPALKGFKFGTTIYSDWSNTSYREGSNKASTNSFNLNRAYLTLTKDVNDWLSMNLTADLFTSKDAQDKGNGLELRVKYAYADLKLFGTSTKIGMVPTPSDAYDNAIWPYRVQGKNLLDDLGIQSSADVGIVNEGNIGGTMDADYQKHVSNKFAGRWGGYMVGIYNGAGYDNPEANNNKTVSALIYLRPFPDVAILKGLQLAYFGNYGDSNANFAAGDTTAYPKWRVNVAQASLQNANFAIMGQYYWGKATKSSTDENDRKGYLVSGYVRIPGVEKLRAFGKVYKSDPNTDAQDKSSSTYVAGLSYDVSKEFMPFIAWERQDNKINASGTDYNKLQLGFQLKF